MSALQWVAAGTRPDLLADPVNAVLTGLSAEAVGRVEVAEIDPDLADTQALVDATDVTLASSANCIIVLGKRGGEERIAAALVLATTRADVNTVIRKRLDARKCSFMSQDRAVEATGMEYGGITPLGLPDGWPVLVDSRVIAAPAVVIGSGLRRSKVRVPGAMFAGLPGVEVVDGLALDLPT